MSPMDWMPIIATVLCSGGILLYCKSIDKRIIAIDKKISSLPKEYVLKADCNKAQAEIRGMITEQRHSLQKTNSKVGYLQGLRNGGK